jgi:hypothetical protein
VLRWMLRKNAANDWLNAYRCRWCGHWHVGHMPGFIREVVAERRTELN